MPACANIETPGAWLWRPLLYLVFVGLCGGSPSLALASGFKVSSVQARLGGQTLSLNGAIDLGLTPEVEEAVNNGIPIELAIDLRLYRHRTFMWDQKVASWALRRELRYHALTGQYLISADAGAPVLRESFASLNDALIQMGSLADLTLTVGTPVLRDAEYRLDVRARLDIEALPTLLRPLAYTSRAWDLNSGWTTWEPQR